MPLYKVVSPECPEALSSFVSKRLRGRLALRAVRAENSVAVDVPGELTDEFAAALAELIVLDLREYETARLISRLPIGPGDGGELLPRVLARGEAAAWLAAAKRELKAWLACSALVIPEGFLRFRLPSVLEDWAVLVDAAGRELMVQREYSALMQLFSAFAEAEFGSSRPRMVRLILHADGSATVNDELDTRIECSAAESSCIISVLMGLSPRLIEVYDLTREGRALLLGAIKAVFGERVRLFTLAGRPPR